MRPPLSTNSLAKNIDGKRCCAAKPTILRCWLEKRGDGVTLRARGSLLLHSGKRNSKLTSIPSFKKVELYTKLPSCCLHFSQKDIRQRVSRIPQDAHPDDLWNRLLEQLDPFPAESFSDSE